MVRQRERLAAQFAPERPTGKRRGDRRTGAGVSLRGVRPVPRHRPYNCVVSLFLDRAALQSVPAGSRHQEAPERSYGHCAGIA